MKTSAAAPGRSGIGIRTSAKSSTAPAPVGRFMRARRACSSRDSRPSLSEPATTSRISVRPRISASRPRTIDALFCSQMSSQIPGRPEAIRVISRKPPAASRSSAMCSSDRLSAMRINVAAARCGTWLTTATRSSCCTASIATISAPNFATKPATTAKAASEE